MKTSKNVSHILYVPQGDCEESIIFIKFLECCYFHYLLPYCMCATVSPTSERARGRRKLC
jgi:hypothetical protein